MKRRFSPSILAFALVLATTGAMPFASVRADTTPDIVNNATSDGATPPNSGTGNYDGFDRFRDSTGRPLPGWQYLFYSPG